MSDVLHDAVRSGRCHRPLLLQRAIQGFQRSGGADGGPCRLLGMAYCARVDGHTRVDVLYNYLPVRARACLDVHHLCREPLRYILIAWRSFHKGVGLPHGPSKQSGYRPPAHSARLFHISGCLGECGTQFGAGGSHPAFHGSGKIAELSMVIEGLEDLLRSRGRQ